MLRRILISLALVATSAAAAPAAAAPVPLDEGAQLWINLDRTGRASGMLWLSEPPPRPAELAHAFGAVLGTPFAAPPQSDAGPWVIAGPFASPLSRRGLVVSGSLDLAPLIEELHAQELEPLQVEIRYPAAAFATVAGHLERNPLRGEHDLVLSTGSVPDGSRPIAVEFGFRRSDLAWLFIYPAATLLLPIPVVAWLRRRALRRAGEEPARIWFGYWRTVQMIQTALWLVAMAGLSLTQPYRLATYLLPRHEALAGIVGSVLLYMLPAALATLAIAGLSHAVSVRVRGVKWTLAQTMVQATLHMAAVLVPFTALLFGLVALFVIDRRLGAALLVGAVVARIVLLQRWVRSMGWNLDAVTRGDLRDRVFALAAKAGVKLRQLYVIPMTRNPMANAFAVRGSTVMLTDYLLAQLTRREVDAVLAHELVHLKRRHAMLLALTLAVTAVSTCAVLPFGGLRAPLLLVLALISMIVVSMIARRFERQADLGAIALTGDPESLISGLAHLHRLNCVPLDWNKWDEKLLSHPSALRRAQAIAAQAGLPPQRVGELMAFRDDAGDRYATTALPVKVFSSATKMRTTTAIAWKVLGLYAVVPAAVAALGAWSGQARWIWDLATAAALVVLSIAAIDVVAVQGFPGLRKRLVERLRREGRMPEDGATFVGLAPGPAPRIYENFFDWDLGFVRTEGDGIRYEGEESRFVVRRAQVRAIELCPGSPGWIPSQRVRVRWEDPSRGTSGIFTLRPAEARRLSRVRGDARRLHAQLTEWWTSTAPAAILPLETQSDGAPTGTVTGVSPRALANRASLIAGAILGGSFAAAACAILGASFRPAAGMGFLDVWAIALAPQLVHRIPLWLYRDREAEASTGSGSSSTVADRGAAS